MLRSRPVVPAPQLSLSRPRPVNDYKVPLPDKNEVVFPALSLEEELLVLPGVGEPRILDSKYKSISETHMGRPEPAALSRVNDSRASARDTAAPVKVEQKAAPSSRETLSAERLHRRSAAGSPARHAPNNAGWNNDVKTPPVFDPSLSKMTLFRREGRERRQSAAGSSAHQRPGKSAYEQPVGPPVLEPGKPQKGTSKSAKHRRRRSPLLRRSDPKWAHVSSQYAQRPPTSPPAAALRRALPESESQPTHPRRSLDRRTETIPAPETFEASRLTLMAPLVNDGVAELAARATAAGPIFLHTTHSSLPQSSVMPNVLAYEGIQRVPPPLAASPLRRLPPTPHAQEWSPTVSGSTRTPSLPRSFPGPIGLEQVDEPSPATIPPAAFAPPALPPAQTSGASPLLSVNDAARVLGSAAASIADLEALLRRLKAIQSMRDAAHQALEAHQDAAMRAIVAARCSDSDIGARQSSRLSSPVSRALTVAAHELIINEQVGQRLSTKNQPSSGVAGAGANRVTGSLSASRMMRQTRQHRDYGDSESDSDHLQSLPLAVVMAVAEQELTSDSLAPADGLVRRSVDEAEGGAAQALAHTGRPSAAGVHSGSITGGTGNNLIGALTTTGATSSIAGSTASAYQGPRTDTQHKSVGRCLKHVFPSSLPPPAPLFYHQMPRFSSAIMREATGFADAVHRCARINEVSLTAAGIDPLRLVEEATVAITDVIIAEVTAELTDAVDGVAEALIASV